MYRKYLFFGAGICTLLIFSTFSDAQLFFTKPTGTESLIANAGGPYKGSVHQKVQFEGSATGGIHPYKYSWDFGDETFSIEQNPLKEYEESGQYIVILTVIDEKGNIDINYTSVEIGIWHLKANIEIKDNYITEGETVVVEGFVENNGFEDTPSGEYEAWIEEFVLFPEDKDFWNYYDPLIAGEFTSISVVGKIPFYKPWTANKIGLFRACIKTRAGNVTVFDNFTFIVHNNLLDGNPDGPNNNSNVIDYECNAEDTGSDIVLVGRLKNRAIIYTSLILRIIKKHFDKV